jgi:hypothetical protein
LVVAGGLAAAGLVRAIGASAKSPPGTQATVEPKGKMVLGWHAGIASRWLDPQEHDGGATPDNFLMALHDAHTPAPSARLPDAIAAPVREPPYRSLAAIVYQLCKTG